MANIVYIGQGDPVEPPPNNEAREHYSIDTDTLWSFSDPWEDENYRWMCGITNASRFDAELAQIKALGAPPEIFGIPVVMTRMAFLNN